MKTLFALALTLGLSPFLSSHANAAACRSGTEEVFLEDDGSGDHLVPVHYVCRHGHYVMKFADYRRYYSPRYSSRNYSCREGAEEMFLEDDGSGEHMVPVYYVCRGGKFRYLYGNPNRYGR